MKYFNPGLDESVSKINFVDENNVFVGFDYEGQCCEYYGWYINKPSGETILNETNSVEAINEALEGWVFDTAFCFSEQENSFFNDKNKAIFRLVKEDQELFLYLFNEHNGYYSHGFEMFQEGVTLHKGWL